MKKTLKSIVLFANLMLCIPLFVYAQWSTPSPGGTINNNILNSKVGISNGSAFNALDRLEVRNGNIVLDYGGNTSTGNIYFGGKTDNNQSGLRLSHVNLGSSYIDARTGGAAASNGLIFRIDALGTGNNERMRINANGNVGINTAGLASGPTEKLQIDKGVLKISSGNAYGGPMMLFSGNPANPYVGDWGIEYVINGKKGVNFWKPSGSPNAGNNFLFLADQTGNVGIRTDNPTANFTVNGNVLIGDPNSVDVSTPGINYKLYVETGILTEKVLVTVKNSSKWADYVFDKEYKLKDISELESFVKLNKHLPNVPSAEAVVKDGIDVATMDAKLLEKIEELTLYIIELHKRLEVLEKNNKKPDE